MALEFKTAKKRNDVIQFNLDGETYDFTPPKQAVMVLPVVMAEDSDAGMIEQVKAPFDWLSTGLPEDQNVRLIARLKDPKDDLDIDDLEGIITGLQEAISGRPTT